MATLRRRITLSLLGVVALAIAVFAYALSHESACEPAPALAPGAATMRAVVRRCYGPPEVLAVETIEKPVPADDQLLVRVHAASINPVDWHYMRGEPYIMRLDVGFGAPENPRVGTDFAGTVEAVGKARHEIQAG